MVMDKKRVNEKEDIQKTYYCVFYPKVECPIRTMWKLKPESLAPFCQACSKIYIVGKISE